MPVRDPELRGRWLPREDGHRFSTHYVELDRTRVRLESTERASSKSEPENRTVYVNVPIPDGSRFYVTAQAREPS